MSPQRRQEIERLYHAAAERDAGGRAAYLREACGGDESLLQEVESLFADAAPDSTFLEAPPLEMAAGISPGTSHRPNRAKATVRDATRTIASRGRSERADGCGVCSRGRASRPQG